METRQPNIRQLVPLVMLVLATVLIVLLGWRAYGGGLPLQPTGYRVEVPLPSALNLEVGSDVTISGVRVGDVVEVRRERYAPIAIVELEPRYAPLRGGVRAIPRTKSLLGEGYIELTRGRVEAAAIREGSRLPVGSADEAQSIDDVLETFSPAARREMKRLAGGLAAAVRGRSADISDSLGNAAPLTTSLEQVMTELDAQRPRLAQLVSRSADVFAALGDREGSLRAAVRASRAVLDTTARSKDALRATLRSLPPFLGQLRTASDELGSASGELARAVDALAPSAPLVLPVLEGLTKAAPQAERTFARLRPLMTTSKTALPATDRIARTFSQAAPPIYDTSRELIPTVRLASVVRRSVVTFFANLAAATNGKELRADGTPEHAISAIPSFWNETAGGWVKKLPSSRANPYPIPDALGKVGTQGLKTFDCRHTGNREYVPPTGGRGAPPCNLQGPWTFEGKTAYYHMLERAKP